jgi:hypothetical protein
MHEDSSQRSSSNSATEVAWQLPEYIQIVDQVFLSLAWGGSATAEAVNDAAYTQHVLMQSAMADAHLRTSASKTGPLPPLDRSIVCSGP